MSVVVLVIISVHSRFPVERGHGLVSVLSSNFRKFYSFKYFSKLYEELKEDSDRQDRFRREQVSF